MYQPYFDIRERIPADPIWYDENGVPRYDEFTPGDQADIYADEVAILKIACQSCDREFKVAVSWGKMDWVRDPESKPLSEDVQRVYYGDAPCWPKDEALLNKFGQCSGSTMTSTRIAVLEFWQYNNLEWVRRPDLEIVYEDDR